MVCADGRVPEIARILRLKGARMILDAANLVCSAPDPKELINQQYAFILRERARENGVYIALCDKCGVEDSSVTMAGRSLVVGPDGEIRAECSPDREEILNVEIDLNAVPEELRGCAADCSTLTCPTEDLSAFQEREHSYPLKSLECYTAVARFAYCGCDEYVGKSLKYIELCQKALCRFIVLPYAEGLDLTDALPAFAAAVRGDCAVAVGYTAGGAASAGIVYSGKVTQVPKGLSDRTLDLFDGVKLAVLFSGEMEAPEAPRVSMLQGADILLWMDGDEGSGHYRRTMQTRSAENRVFSVRSTPCRSAGYSLIVNPDGAVVCTTFKTAEHTAFGMIYAALSKCKTVISGTDIVQSRMPHAYGELLQYGRPSAEL